MLGAERQSDLLLDRILILDRVDLRVDGILVAEIVMLDRLEGLLIKFIDKRDTGRDIESGDIGIGDVVKILD